MARGKTKYVVPITDPRIAQDVMNEYLSNYDYRQMSENGVVYYKSGYGFLTAAKLIEYQITAYELIIFAYLGNYKKPMSISDNGFFGVLIKVRLREEIDKVIAEIRRRESNGTAFSNANPNPMPNNTVNYQNNSTTAYQHDNTANYQNSNTTAYQNGNTANYQNNNSTTYNQVNQASILREDNMKVRNTLAIVGFVLSILSLLFSCVGALPGLIMYVIVFYCASQGMKSKYRGLAIATFVISALGILILLGVLALAMFGILFS